MQTKNRRNTLNIYDDKTFGAFNDKKHANKVVLLDSYSMFVPNSNPVVMT